MRFLPAAFVLAGLLAPPLPAQDPGRFAAEPAVITRLDEVIAMQPDGTGYRERTAAIRIQSEAAVHEFSVLSFPFAGASEHVDLHYVRVRRADGTVVETPAADAQEQPTAVTREAPFYSDQKEKQIPVRSLRVGDTLEWQVRNVRTKAEAPGQFWGEDAFSDTLVTLEESVELRVAQDSPVHVWTRPNETKPAETTTATERVYRWQHHNLKPTTGPVAEIEKEDAKRHTLTPEEELDAREGKLPAYAWSTFASWAAVGDWYRSLERDRHTPDADIKAKVAELTAGKVTLEAKVRAVYDYDALQVRYVGVAFGVGRYQPHPAAEVLSNQYGDCKDKHTLLAAMLIELGLHPDAVLIGQGIRFNPDLPSPGAFNHLITQVAVAGQPVWLDATEEIAPYGMLMLPLRDRQALVIPESGTPALSRTPADPPFASVATMKAVGSLDKDGTSNSRITITVRGDNELLMRTVLRRVPAASYPELIQKLSEGMGYGGTASHPDFSRPEDTANPFTWSYDYKREKGGDWEHYRIIPQLAYRSLPVIDPKEPPLAALDLGVPRTETSSAAMKLPVGWSAELPEAVHARSAFATLDQTYRLADGTVYADQRVTILVRYIPAAEWKVYQKFIDKAGLDNQVYIQLTRTGASARPALPAAGADNSAKAAQLIRDAFTAMQKADFSSAVSLLHQAGELNKEQRDLLGAKGALAYDRGEYRDAIANYKAELDRYPDSLWVYAPLARAQANVGQPADALASLRAWIALAPDSEPASLQLAVLQLQQPDASAAQHAHAAATLAELCRSSDTSLTMNDAAYALADANLELSAAEEAEQKALGRLVQESMEWTLDEAPDALLGKSSLLIASWDTLGWIYFRQGRLDDALAQVQASWLNHQSPVVGEHLGDIQSARGKQNDALAAYEMALSQMPHSAPETDRKRLRDKAAAARKAGGAFDPYVAQARLSQMRTHNLGPAAARNGAAEYTLLLSAEKVQKARPSGEKIVLAGAGLLESQRIPQLIPAGSTAKLVRSAILNCHAGACDLIFEP